jgi:DNA-binding protein YbaB
MMKMKKELRKIEILMKKITKRLKECEICELCSGFVNVKATGR